MDKPKRLRLFVGIALSEPVRAGCADVISRLEGHGFRASYEQFEKLHITLAFLGNVEPDRVEAIERTLRAVAREAEPLVLTLDKLGAFPHERKPRIVYVGSREQGAAFRGLTYGVRGAYRDLGFVFEDDAVAHVTIARVKERDRRHPLPLLNVPPMQLRVDSICLFESLPSTQTTRYELRARAALGLDAGWTPG